LNATPMTLELFEQRLVALNENLRAVLKPAFYETLRDLGLALVEADKAGLPDDKLAEIGERMMTMFGEGAEQLMEEAAEKVEADYPEIAAMA